MRRGKPSRQCPLVAPEAQCRGCRNQTHLRDRSRETNCDKRLQIVINLYFSMLFPSKEDTAVKKTSFRRGRFEESPIFETSCSSPNYAPGLNQPRFIHLQYNSSLHGFMWFYVFFCAAKGLVCVKFI